MKRVIILGRGGAGKSTAALQLSKITKLPVIELDKYFWQAGLQPTPLNQWKHIQRELTNRPMWIIEGDFGKYDSLEVRLKAADAIIVLDFSFPRCLFRAIKRSPERADFWWWLFTWRLLSRPKLLQAIKANITNADVYILRSPKALERLLSSIHP